MRRLLVEPLINLLSSRTADARKTVTFGDASSVRSLPLWSAVSFVLLAAFWYLSTRPWGLPSSFVDANPGLSDKDLLAACDRDPGCADLHSGAGNRIQHPGRHNDHHTRRRLDVNSLTRCAMLAVGTTNAVPVERMPAVVNNNILPDMGRMTPRLPSGARTICSPAAIAAESDGQWYAPSSPRQSSTTSSPMPTSKMSSNA